MPFTSANLFFTQLSDYNMLYGISGLNAAGQPNYFWSPGLANNGIATPTVVSLTPGSQPFKADKNNIAPSFGVAWKVPVKRGGWLSWLLSDDPVLRGGYSRAYTREGLSTVADIFAANPGGNIPASRNQGLGNLINPGQSWPLLLRQTNQLAPPPFASTPSYPLTVSFANSINAFAPDTQTPWVHSFNIGFQRAITKNSVIELRYVGTRARGGWVDGGRGINELNVVENGWMTEFQHAQANLLVNEKTYNTTWGGTPVTGKVAGSFAYNGLTGQYPLPLIQSYFTGVAQTTANNPALYTSANYANSTWLNYLTPTNPNPTGMAANFFTDATLRGNGTNAGEPTNLFYMNPAISGNVWVTGRPQDQLMSNFDATQLEFRRRMSGGLQVSASYQYIIRQNTTSYVSVRTGPEMISQSSPKHAVKFGFNYELPFGQGRRWGGGAGRILNEAIGGWSIDGNARLQSGNILDFGNVLLVGMTDQQLQDAIGVYTMADSAVNSGGNPNILRVFMLPQDIIKNTILAYSTSATSPTGYSGAAPSGRYFAPIRSSGCLQPYAGACVVNGQIVTGPADHHYVTGPAFMRIDLAVTKRFDVYRRVNAELRIEALNVLNNIDWLGVTTLGGTTANSYQITSAYSDMSNTQDPGGRILQLSWRINF